MTLIENLLNIFFIEEKTEDSIELTVKENKEEETEQTLKSEEIKSEKVELEIKSEKIELEIKHEEQEQEQKQEEHEEHEEAEVQEESKKELKTKTEEESKHQEEKKIQHELERKDKKQKLKNKLKEELKNELRKEFLDKKQEEQEEQEQEQEVKLDKQLNLYIFNEYFELLSSLKEMSLVILNDKDKKRQLKKFLIENNISNIVVLSSLKDLKKKITTIPDIKYIIIDGLMFEDNKDSVVKFLNIEGKFKYGIYYLLEEYKTVIKTFSSLEKVKMITNKSTFKRSKFQEVMRKLKVSDDEVDLI